MHKAKGFELYTLLNREPMKGEYEKMIKFCNATYEMSSRFEKRLKLKSVGGRVPDISSSDISLRD